MRGTTPKSVLWPGMWPAILSFAFAIACTGATDDAVTQADIDVIVETAVAAAAAPSTAPTAPIASIDVEATVAAAVEATMDAAAGVAVEAAEAEVESIIEATVEAAVQATVIALPTPSPSPPADRPTPEATHPVMTMDPPTPETTQPAMAMAQPTPTVVAGATGALPTSTQASAPPKDPAFQEVAIIENYAATRFYPRAIVVLKGVPVRLYLTRLHREHVNLFEISPFFSSSDVILPGEVGVLNFTPDRAGTFKIRNVGHNFEADLVVVESKQDIANFYADRGRQMYALIHSIDDFRIFPENLTLQDGVPTTIFNISLIAQHRVSFKPFHVPVDINVLPGEITTVEFAPDQQGAFTVFHELHGFSGALIVE
ncbi:MAG: hypothetical protein O6922_05540 [Chloroflexi bacterium]|nr:hypothetical protein [Chloroflexota bacterium]